MKAGCSLILLCLLVFCCFATAQGDRQGCAIWSWWPSNSQWRNAAVNAVRPPGTWLPVICAAVIAAGGWDREISDWAIQERPVFGSYEAAQDASDMLCSSAHIGMVVTVLTVPGDDAPWLLSTTRRIVWEHVGVIAAASATDPIKRLTDRERPNGGKRGFPSWHATRAASYVGMGCRNLDLINLRRAYRRSAQFILASLAAGTAWARVEAGEHYPTEVLAGTALGNFIALLVHDAFLGRSERHEVYLQTDIGGVSILKLEVRF